MVGSYRVESETVREEFLLIAIFAPLQAGRTKKQKKIISKEEEIWQVLHLMALIFPGTG